MEGLYMALNDGLATNMFNGVKVGSPGMHLSHLLYVDDVIILSEWYLNVVENIIRILIIFYIASGLKINIYKSNVYGVRVSSNEVEIMASYTGCEAGFFPFTYLGLPIALGSSEDSEKLAWVKWSNIFASFDKGGLGVGSLKAFNMSLLLKWRWPHFHNLNALWFHVVKAIHGDEAGIDIRGCHTNGV
ncbi:RNA-directed DNA polymerase, eukaryota, reverse transcriptase zinc-binding domain protein [Tanacetum coccineum]